MTNDVFLVLGLICSGLAVPSLIGAFSEGRAPRAAAILVMIGGGLVVTAVSQKPGGYSIQDVPAAFVRVIGYYTN